MMILEIILFLSLHRYGKNKIIKSNYPVYLIIRYCLGPESKFYYTHYCIQYQFSIVYNTKSLDTILLH